VQSEQQPSRETVEPLIAAKGLGVPTPESIKYPDDEPPLGEEIELGTTLFFEKKLSGSQRISCATCHDPTQGFSDSRPQSINDQGNTMLRNAPHLYNLAWNRVLFWDGRAGSLDTMALSPIMEPNNMNLPLDTMVKRLQSIPYYAERFEDLYPDGLTAENVGKAISAFQRSLISRDSAFDRYLRGDDAAMSAKALRGLMLFVGKANCTTCHDGVNFTDESFHNIGIVTSDIGRGKFEKGTHFQYAFKTPGLRNVALTGPYMHDGSIKTLREIVQFYDKGGKRREGIDRQIAPLHLTDEESDELVAFLEALTDPIAVTPPAMALSATKRERKTNGTLSGWFSFLKEPPQVGLIFFSEDQELQRAVTIDQQGKKFLNAIAVGSPGEVITFKNSDAISHNVYANDKRLNAQFDLGLAPPKSDFLTKQSLAWAAGGSVKIGCKIHPDMQSYVVSLSSRYYKEFEFRGERSARFTFTAPPAQLTKVAIWLPEYGLLEVPIALGERKEVELEKGGKLQGIVVLRRQ
jgi:cytochrome c peroxidase